MKRLLVIVLFLILAGTAALYFMRDPGTADIALLGWQLHTTALGFLALIIGLMIVLSILWRLITAVLRLPAFFRARSARARQKQADDALLRAFAESTRKRFTEAETLALAHQADGSVGPMHFVLAVDAALSRGDVAAALTHLDQARARYPRFAGYLALHLANRLSAAGHHHTAIELLQRLYSTHEQDDAILLALADALYNGEDWDKLHSLMPALRRIKSAQLAEQTLWQWERGQLLGRLPAIIRAAKPEALANWSAQIPKKLKTDPSLVRAEAEAAQALGQPERARQILERSLEQAPSVTLLDQWLALPPPDADAASGLLQRLTSAHPGAIDAESITLAQARLAMRRDDLSTANELLTPLLAGSPNPAAYRLAAELAERQRDSTSACAWYAKALANRNVDA